MEDRSDGSLQTDAESPAAIVWDWAPLQLIIVFLCSQWQSDSGRDRCSIRSNPACVTARTLHGLVSSKDVMDSLKLDPGLLSIVDGALSHHATVHRWSRAQYYASLALRYVKDAHEHSEPYKAPFALQFQMAMVAKQIHEHVPEAIDLTGE